jgi:hypothetical protein
MEQLIVDPTSLGPLANLAHGVELRNLAGQPLGWFFPATQVRDYEGYECPLSDDELDRISEEGGGRELPEILRDLEKLS